MESKAKESGLSWWEELNAKLQAMLESIKAYTQELPPLDVLERVKNSLENLASTLKAENQSGKSVIASFSWPSDLRLVIRKFIGSFKTPEEYINMCYELCNAAMRSLGAEWIKSDTEFLKLLANFSNSRIRHILNKTTIEKNVTQLVACLQLQEYFFVCVKGAQNWLSEEDAAVVANCCLQVVIVVCEYLIECGRLITEQAALRMEMCVALYRFVCTYLSSGGVKFIDMQLLTKTLPILIILCKYCMSQQNPNLAWYLLRNLPLFADPLPNECLALLVQYIVLSMDASATPYQELELLAQSADLLDQFAGRQGWYTEQSLCELEQLAETNKHRDNRRLATLSQHIREGSSRA